MKKITERKRVLVVTQMYPSGSTGTSVKTRNTLAYLTKNGYSFEVVCVHYAKMMKIDIANPHIHVFIVEKETTSKLSLAYLQKAWRLLFSMLPFRVIKLYDKKLKEHIQIVQKAHHYEYIFYDGFSTLQYAQSFSNNHIYIDDEDITDLVKKRFLTASSILLKIFFLSEWFKCIVYERRFLKRMNQIWAISDHTKKRLECVSKVKTIRMPTMVPLKNNVFRPTSQNIVFSGLLSWMENVEGLRWFLVHCWHDIHKKFPQTKLVVTGQMIDKEFLAFITSFPNVQHAGFVDNLSSLYKTCALAISPVFINAGIKVKVLTYLSYGLPVISSTEATGGLSSHGGIVATTKKQFAKEVTILLGDTNRRKGLSLAGRRNIKDYHSDAVLRQFFCKTGVLNE